MQIASNWRSTWPQLEDVQVLGPKCLCIGFCSCFCKGLGYVLEWVFTSCPFLLWFVRVELRSNRVYCQHSVEAHMARVNDFNFMHTSFPFHLLFHASNSIVAIYSSLILCMHVFFDTVINSSNIFRITVCCIPYEGRPTDNNLELVTQDI